MSIKNVCLAAVSRHRYHEIKLSLVTFFGNQKTGAESIMAFLGRLMGISQVVFAVA